jgi:hypothetical protein
MSILDYKRLWMKEWINFLQIIFVWIWDTLVLLSTETELDFFGKPWIKLMFSNRHIHVHCVRSRTFLSILRVVFFYLVIAKEGGNQVDPPGRCHMQSVGRGETSKRLMKLSISRPDNVVGPWLALLLFRYTTTLLSNPHVSIVPAAIWNYSFVITEPIEKVLTFVR